MESKADRLSFLRVRVRLDVIAADSEYVRVLTVSPESAHTTGNPDVSYLQAPGKWRVAVNLAMLKSGLVSVDLSVVRDKITRGAAKRVRYTFAQKLEVISKYHQLVASGFPFPTDGAASIHSVHQSLVVKWVKKEDVILEATAGSGKAMRK
ncbi:hypothetical protein CYMTET_42181 [Cymbomonas tetramitiformis]|uniref:Uncharacterized protein n=1 Tax=Cymbomonas tetramitiformis TaxID=36881 RepID=A0AAE0F1H6_9CHLO|nr:hypothetical protein CYMTET_42181 [Cymbomonas tetramitiformis]